MSLWMRPRSWTWPSAAAKPMARRRKRGQLQRSALRRDRGPIQRLAAGVLEHEHRTPFVARERQRPDCPGGIQFGGERVFVLEPPQALRRRLFRGERHRQDRRGLAVLPAPVKRELPAFPQGLQRVSATHRHGAASAAPGRRFPSCAQQRARWFHVVHAARVTKPDPHGRHGHSLQPNTGEDASHGTGLACAAAVAHPICVHDLGPHHLSRLHHRARGLARAARGAAPEDREPGLPPAVRLLVAHLRGRLWTGRGHGHRHGFPVRHQLERALAPHGSDPGAAARLRKLHRLRPRGELLRRADVRPRPRAALVLPFSPA